jgi:preprotein translocase subunit SecG
MKVHHLALTFLNKTRGVGVKQATNLPYRRHTNGKSCASQKRSSLCTKGDRAVRTLIAFGPCFGVDSDNIRGVSGLRSNLKRIAWLCLLLTFASALAFAWHHHSNATESAKCTVCVAAHSAAPKASAKLPNATFVPIGTSRVEPVSAKQRLVVFALSVRPPPAV